MTCHLQTSVLEFIQFLKLSPQDNILEIGANEGVCIQELLNKGFVNVVGIDPAKNIHSRHNLPIVCDFFGKDSLSLLQSKFSTYKLIYAFHCLAHIENIQGVFQAIYTLLCEDVVCIIEVGYFLKVLQNNTFDVVYHEHIDYHTCTALDKFSKQHNLVLFHIKENNIQGGSMQLYFSKNKDIEIHESVAQARKAEQDAGLFDLPILTKWQVRIQKVCEDVRTILHSFLNNGKTIAGFGASAKSTTFMHHLRLSNQVLKYIIDDNVYKQNFLSPGLHIPIANIDKLKVDRVDYVLILSCNFVEDILKKLEPFRKTGLRIIVPFPEIRII